MPSPLANVAYGLAHANNVAKLVFVLVNASKSESLPVDSLGKPISITCKFPIAIFSPYSVFIRIGLNVRMG